MKARRKTASQNLEKDLWSRGFQLVAGIDEAGRGPLAGPVCSAVVIFEPGVRIPGVFDSKQLEPEEREELFHKILAKALAVGVGTACAEEIDQLNILRATKLAARRALRQLAVMPDYLLLDALILDKVTLPQTAITKGDARSFSIAAASIVAKVSRDRLMVQCSEQYPGYGFENHKGYGTPTHRRRIAELGRTTLHRQTFLESWFGTDPLKDSLFFQDRLRDLHACACADEIHAILQRVRDQKAWLPVCEWRRLQEMATTCAQAMMDSSVR